MKFHLLFAVTCAICVIAKASSTEEDLNRLFTDLLSRHNTTGEPTLAVLPFVPLSENISAKAGRAVAEYAVSFIIMQQKYRVVERMEFSKVCEELALSNTGITEESQMITIGKMLSAEVIVTGTIGNLLGKQMISARIIRVETGEILAASSISVEDAQINAFYKDALGERTQLSASVFRSLMAPGWGQFYTSHPGQGALFSCSALAGSGVFIWSAIDWAVKSSDVTANHTAFLSNIPAEDTRLKELAKDERDKAIDRTAVIGGITGAIWVINLIDAAILGNMEKHKVQKLYFSASQRDGIECAVTIRF